MIKSKMLNCCIESSHIAHCPVLFFIRFFEGGRGVGERGHRQCKGEKRDKKLDSYR